MTRTTIANGSALATARVQWQFGIWEALAAIEPDAPDSIKRGGERDELLHYLLQGALQTGRADIAREMVEALRSAGAQPGTLLRDVVSSAFNSLGRGWLVAGEVEKAERCIRQAVELYPELGEGSLVARMRFNHQFRDLVHAGAPIRHLSPYKKDRRLFIDCGGYDGCSVLKFLMTEPHYDCVTFEPNPELWKYYDAIPTQLIRKAAYTYDGEIDFIIDPVDGDGSSIFAAKQIDFTRQVSNQDCPVISTPCVDLSAFVRTAAETYGTIVLKLDVEGAEYDILEKMIEDGTIAHVDQLKCEFHGHKMGVDPKRHKQIFAEVGKRCPIEEWDAIAFSVHENMSPRAGKLRQALIRAISSNRDAFQAAGDSRSI